MLIDKLITNEWIEKKFPFTWILVRFCWIRVMFNSFVFTKMAFLYDRLCISPWIKSISNNLNIIIHVIALQLLGYCDVFKNWLWHHQQHVNWVSETWVDLWRSLCLWSYMDLLYHVRNIIMYELSWQTVYVLTRVLFWCLFSLLLRNSGNKHQNNHLVSAEIVHHLSTYIIKGVPGVILCFCTGSYAAGHRSLFMR